MDDLARDRALATGSEAAFHLFMEEQATRVFRICYRILGRVDEAQDATQEIFVLAYRALPTYRADGPASAWIARIATRHCWRKAASASRRAALPSPLDEATAATLAGTADPAGDAITAEEHEAVRRAVKGLPDPYREVVTLRYFGGLSLASIAAATGRPEQTIKTQLRRGLDRLRAAMGDGR